MKKQAFTLVELLAVIIIIGVLSLVIIFAIRQTSFNAKIARKDADLKLILTAIEAKRAENSTILFNITKDWCSACQCISNGNTPQSAGCISRMQTAYQNLGFNQIQLDPWGNPYMIDENELENNSCGTHDNLYSFQHGNIIDIPFYICP